MTEKQFTEVKGYCYDKKTCIGVIQDDYTCKNMINLLNEQKERIKELESENKMLKVTIGRNESYIKRLTMKGKWSNTGDAE